MDVAVVLLAVGCFLLTLAQRTFSTLVRTIRRKTLGVEGHVDLADGERLSLSSEKIILVPERALLLLGAAVVMLTAGLLTLRRQIQ